MRILKYFLLLYFLTIDVMALPTSMRSSTEEKFTNIQTQVIEIKLPKIDEPLKIEYLKQGKGKPLILLHGFGSSLFTWRNNIDELSKHFTVYAYNHLGTGKSNNPFIDPKRTWYAAYYLEPFQWQMLSFMDELGIDEAFLVGNSMGCQIALAFAGEFPDRVSGFTLIDPSGGSKTGETFMPSFKKIRDYSNVDKTFPPDEIKSFVRNILHEVYFKDDLVTDNLVEKYYEQWKTKEGRGALNRITLAFYVPNPQRLYNLLYGAWTIKTGQNTDHSCLVMWGKNDPWFPYEGLSDYTTELEGASTVLVDNAGHVPHAEQPDIINREIVNVFKGKKGILSHQKITFDNLKENLKSKDNGLVVNTVRALRTMKEERAVKAIVSVLDHSLIVGEVAEHAIIEMGESAVGSLIHDVGDWNIMSLLKDIGEPAVKPLIGVLNSEDYRVRKNAAKALGEIKDSRAAQPLIDLLRKESHSEVQREIEYALINIGKPAVNPLLILFKEENPKFILPLIEIFGKIKDPQPVKSLINLINNQDMEVRKAVYWALGEIADSTAVDPLIAALTEERRDNLGSICQALGNIKSEKAVQPLILILKSNNQKVARESADALIKIGTPAIIPLANVFQSDSGFVRNLAAEALGEIGGTALDPLISSLNNANSGLKMSAVLGLKGIKNERIIEPLISALSDENKTVRDTIGQVLIKFGESAVQPLITALNDKSEIVRRCVAWNLGELKNRNAVSPLIATLKIDADSLVRLQTAYALGKIKDKKAVPLLCSKLNDPYWNVRLHSAWALGEITDSSAVDALIRALEDENPDVRFWVVDALGDIKNNRAIVPLAEKLKNNPAEKVRKSAAWALGNIGDKVSINALVNAFQNDASVEVKKYAADALVAINDIRAVKPFCKALKDDSVSIRAKAAFSLGKLKYDSSVKALIETLKDQEVEPRKLAVWALGEIKDDQATQPVIHVLKNDNSALVRSYAAGTLGKMKSEAGVTQLIQALRDIDSEVRSVAAWSLGEIKNQRAIEPLISAFLEKNKDIYNSIGQALEKITGQKYGSDQQAWQQWWQKNK